MVEADAAIDRRLIGTPASPAMDLEVGANLVGLCAVAPGLDAFAVLDGLGDAGAEAGITRLDPDTRRFVSAMSANGRPVGVNFRILPGEAYLLFMRQTVEGFSMR